MFELGKESCGMTLACNKNKTQKKPKKYKIKEG